MPNYDPTKTRLGNYDVTWNSNFLGAVKDVKVNIPIKTLPKKLGSLGDIELGSWIIGLDGEVTCGFQEIDLTLMQRMMPWYTSGNIPLVPATWHKDMYDYAQSLILHPSDLPTATVTQDIVLTKAVPMRSFMERNGEDQDVVNVVFKIYPDRAQLTVVGAPVLAYGNFGNA